MTQWIRFERGGETQFGTLEGETITRPSGEKLAFSPDPFLKHCLLNGLNEIDLSLQFGAEMDTFETAHRARFPWVAPQGN